MNERMHKVNKNRKKNKEEINSLKREKREQIR